MNDKTCPPPIHPFTDVRLDVPQLVHLSNGIPIYIINGGEDGVNQLSVFVRGGALTESIPMLSVLTGLTATEGTATRTCHQIAETLDYYGAWKSVQGYDEWVELTMSSLNSNYQVSLDILCDCLTHPTFLPEDFGTLQRRYAASFATAHQQVKYLAALELRRMYYSPRHPLAADTTPNDIMSITTAHLQQFHQRHYCTANMCAVLAGEIPHPMLETTDAMLGALSIPGEPLPPFDWDAWRTPFEAQQRVIDHPGALQSAIAIAMPAVPRRHPDYFKIRILATVLGGYFSSRLMTSIREQKGYTYGIHAYLAGREHDGYIGINTECDVKYTWPVLEAIRQEMRRLRAEPVTEEELAQVRQHMLSDLVKTLDTPFSIGRYVSSIFTFGMYEDYFNDQVQAIIGITPAQLLETANQYLHDDLMAVAIATDCNRL